MLILIDSKDRTSNSNSSSNFKIQLSNFVDGTTISLKQFLIPNSIFNIVTGVNDRIVWNRSSTNYSYQIAAGKYTITNLLSTIQSGMNTTDANSYTLSYSSTTFKTTIAGSAAFILNWSSNPNASTSIWRELGFINNDTSSATSHTGTNVVQLHHPLTFIIQIQELGYSGITNRGVPFTFLCIMNSGNGEVQELSENNYFNQTVHLLDHTIHLNSLTIELKYPDGSSLSLNGADWIMILEIK